MATFYSIDFSRSLGIANCKFVNYGVEHGFLELMLPITFEDKGDRWSDESIFLAWQYVCMRYAIENTKSLEDRMQIIADIYRRFDYPENMKHLVYYMPRTAETGSLAKLNDAIFGFCSCVEDMFKISVVFR